MGVTTDMQVADCNAAPRPLSGLRVLDLTMALAGPYCTLMLGGMGAEVIKVESRRGGDLARSNPPFAGDEGFHFGPMREEDISVSILARARNKKSITLDLKSDRGRELFMKLVETADVLVENMSDGTAERLGVGYQAVRKINPKLIYASIAGLGDANPFPNLKAMDIIVQAYSGVMDVTGQANGPPVRFGLPIADLLAPLYALNGILAALIQRGVTGSGQNIKVSMLDCLASLLAVEHFDVLKRFGFPARTGNHMNRLAPFGLFETRDGYVAIAATADEWVRSLFEAMGQDERKSDPRFASRGARALNADAVNGLIESWTRGMTSEQVVEELLTKRGVPCVRVRSVYEVLDDPLLRASGALQPLLHPRFGPIDAVGMGMPIKFSAAVAAFDQPAPELGAHNQEIYGALLGLSAADLTDLTTQGVI
jgi:crotonobetainyl-CoA:carnitine CoA-transferase CaiB-like acyl-CoA transferase